MPSYHEVRIYLSGLWLLIRGDAQGFRMLDISDRGMMRSFWAFVWCLPAMIVSWNWFRLQFLEAGPAGTKTGLAFFIRLALVDSITWLLPLVLAGVLCIFLGIGRKFLAVVVAINWISVPFAYAYGVLILGLTMIPAMAGILALLQLVLMIASVVVLSRILRMICGPQPLVVTALLLVLTIPGLLLTEALQRFVGVYPF